jgi:hypothetical protein
MTAPQINNTVLTQPSVNHAPATNTMASAVSRNAGARGHCGALGEVIGVLSTRG